VSDIKCQISDIR